MSDSMLTGQPSFEDLAPENDDYAAQVIERVLQSAMSISATDVHVSQQDGQIDLRWRVSGQLRKIATIADGTNSKVLNRIKALARLISYRNDIPQEGRMVIRGRDAEPLEARVGTLPILRGERAVIRISKPAVANWQTNQLGLAPTALERLNHRLLSPSGVILISGPAGSGKTTTAYACLRSIAAEQPARAVVTLEDPVEQELPTAAQSQIDVPNDYGWSAGLRAVLRQDPEVLLIGEIRDGETASVVFQAAMTGQLVITTMHARSNADALRRLLDMGVPAQHLRSSLDYLICQRLVPKLCACHAQAGLSDGQPCERCAGIGMDGTCLLAEVLPSIEGNLAKAIVQDADVSELHLAATELGMQSLKHLAIEAAEANVIAATEIGRSVS